MAKKKSNFKGWGNVVNILIKKPAKKAAKKAKTSMAKGLRKALGLPTKRKGKAKK